MSPLHVVTNKTREGGSLQWLFTPCLASQIQWSKVLLISSLHTFRLLNVRMLSANDILHTLTFLAPPLSFCTRDSYAGLLLYCTACMTRQPISAKLLSIAGCGGLLCLLFALSLLASGSLLDSLSCTLHIVPLALIRLMLLLFYFSLETTFTFLYL